MLMVAVKVAIGGIALVLMALVVFVVFLMVREFVTYE
jgi:hypothetical protein